MYEFMSLQREGLSRFRDLGDRETEGAEIAGAGRGRVGHRPSQGLCAGLPFRRNLAKPSIGLMSATACGSGPSRPGQGRPETGGTTRPGSQPVGPTLFATGTKAFRRSPAAHRSPGRRGREDRGPTGAISSGPGKGTSPLGVTPEQVQAAIPHEGALIEYLRYPDYLGKNHWEWRYGALVLFYQGAPVWVPLGKAEEIERLVRRYSRLVRGSPDETSELVCQHFF